MEPDEFFTEPIICYFLDGFLMVYCIIATAFFFKEKFASLPYMLIEAPEETDRIYQELERPGNADPYQLLEPSKRKKRAAKKNKLKPRQVEENGREAYESLVTQDAAPPLPPH